MKFFMIKNLFLKNRKNNNNEKEFIGGNVDILIDDNFKNMDLNGVIGGNMSSRTKYKDKKKIKLNY
jgi:hypothetical protein